MGDAVDRKQIEELLAGATTPGLEPVVLPKRGWTIYLRKELPNSAQVKIGTYAVTGDPDDMQARAVMAVLRFALTDEDGELLLKNYGEAAGLVDQLDEADFEAIYQTIGRLYPLDGAVEDVDQGKGSSGKARSSSRSTTSRSSRTGSRASSATSPPPS